MSLRSQVFRVYRTLQRTREVLFAGDIEALQKARLKIKESFLANHRLTDSEISDQIKIAEETNDFLLQGVVQGKLQDDGSVYKVKISEHTKLHDNVPLKETNKVDLLDFKVPERFKKKQ